VVPDLRAVGSRLEGTFPGRCARSFLEMQGLDRALVLASQSFTALIPLLLLVSALAPRGRRDVVADAVVARFGLSGDSAASVEQLFAHTGSGSIGVFSAVLLLFSGVSLSRRMQRMYQSVWRVEPMAGLPHAVHAALGLLALVVGMSLLYLGRSLVSALPFENLWLLAVSLVLSCLVWTAVPWLLLGRRVPWRRLLPGGALTALATTAYGVASTVYMPRLLESYSDRYGLFGVTLALIGWLLAIAVIVVAATVVAAELDRRPRGMRGPGSSA